MATLVAVIGDRQNTRAHHVRFSGTAAVGRGFQCDIILGDACVEPEQLVFEATDTGYRVLVLPGANPVYRNGKVVAPGSCDFVSGDEWQLGKTLLTAYAENHVLEPTEKIRLVAFDGGITTQAGLFIAGLAALSGWTALEEWLARYRPFEWPSEIAISLLTNGHLWFVMLFSVAMGISARFSTGRSRFNVHFLAAILFVLADAALAVLTDYAAYSFGLPALWDAVTRLGSMLLLATLLLFSFSQVYSGRSMNYMALGLSLCWNAVFYLGEMADRNPLDPSFDAAVKPPFAAVLPAQDASQFLSTVHEALAETAGDAPDKP